MIHMCICIYSWLSIYIRTWLLCIYTCENRYVPCIEKFHVGVGLDDESGRCTGFELTRYSAPPLRYWMRSAVVCRQYHNMSQHVTASLLIP